MPPSERRTVERVRRSRPGEQVLRVSYPSFRGFARRGRGRLEAKLEIEEPKTFFGRTWRTLVGTPIPSEAEEHERLTKKKALAVFSSDALSSVAYAPQETLVVLLAAGVSALAWSMPITLAIIVLLAIVVTSYRQTIYTYPSGGGSYIVAHENLGAIPGLIAAASLIVGYTLTVSVSIASAVDQLVSAVPTLLPLRIWLGIVAILLVTLANLRGVRESGSIFALPTYVFLAAMFGVIGVGLYQLSLGQFVVAKPEVLPAATQPLTLFLVLHAFAVGSAVMTGTEAISNGIPAFEPPESRNAARTLVAMGLILGTMFLGLSLLIIGSGVIPFEHETIISLLARGAFGDSILYYVVQGAATLILVLAANTAFADFPRLASLLARDDYAPHQLANRGERLAFSNGILLLGILAAALIVLFGGSTGALLPLYAVGVFAAFTLSQAGMTVHWLRERGPHWRLKAGINGVGATVTGLVSLIAAVTNFVNPDLPIIPGIPIGWGSWLVLLIIPTFVLIFLRIRRHYEEVDRETEPSEEPTGVEPIKHEVVVPISTLTAPAFQALAYARSISSSVTAVHVATDPEHAARLEREWDRRGEGVPLTIIESPYRSLTRPLLGYLSELQRITEADIVTVVLPEYVPDHWWEHLLHGQSAAFLKLYLLFRPGFVVTSIPYHK